MKNRLFDIVTDSCCDMPVDYYKANAVDYVNLGFTMNNVNYGGEDGEKIEVKEFYQKLRDGAMPTTYQVTSESAREHIEEHLEKGRDVLVITFSSALSGTNGSFVVAAKNLQEKYPDRKIFVVDSLCACMGQGLFLDYVVKKANEGVSIEETRDFAENLKLHICHHFTVDNLFHLKRGGRVSGATAIIGSILKIKPVMHVDDGGHLTVVSKCMGRKKAVHALFENMLVSQELGENDPVFIAHADCMDDAEYLKSLILQKFPKVEITIGDIGAVIGSHAGAGTIALFHKGKKR